METDHTQLIPKSISAPSSQLTDPNPTPNPGPGHSSSTSASGSNANNTVGKGTKRGRKQIRREHSAFLIVTPVPPQGAQDGDFSDGDDDGYEDEEGDDGDQEGTDEDEQANGLLSASMTSEGNKKGRRRRRSNNKSDTTQGTVTSGGGGVRRKKSSPAIKHEIIQLPRPRCWYFFLFSASLDLLFTILFLISCLVARAHKQTWFLPEEVILGCWGLIRCALVGWTGWSRRIRERAWVLTLVGLITLLLTIYSLNLIIQSRPPSNPSASPSPTPSSPPSSSHPPTRHRQPPSYSFSPTSPFFLPFPIYIILSLFFSTLDYFLFALFVGLSRRRNPFAPGLGLSWAWSGGGRWAEERIGSGIVGGKRGSHGSATAPAGGYESDSQTHVQNQSQAVGIVHDAGSSAFSTGTLKWEEARFLDPENEGDEPVWVVTEEGAIASANPAGESSLSGTSEPGATNERSPLLAPPQQHPQPKRHTSLNSFTAAQRLSKTYHTTSSSSENNQDNQDLGFESDSSNSSDDPDELIDIPPVRSNSKRKSQQSFMGFGRNGHGGGGGGGRKSAGGSPLSSSPTGIGGGGKFATGGGIQSSSSWGVEVDRRDELAAAASGSTASEQGHKKGGLWRRMIGKAKKRRSGLTLKSGAEGYGSFIGI